MALNINNYDTALQQGALIQATNLASSSVTAAKIASGAVTGVKLSTGKNYALVAVGTTGATAVNLFGSSTAPVAGTVTGYYTIAATTTVGTFTLWGTTAGTIATITSSGTIGTVVGTGVLNAAIVAGDTVTIKGVGAGTATAFVSFQTAS